MSINIIPLKPTSSVGQRISQLASVTGIHIELLASALLDVALMDDYQGGVIAPAEPAPAAQPTAKVPTSAPSPVRNLANSDPELPELAPLTPANEGMDLLAFADSLDASRVIS